MRLFDNAALYSSLKKSNNVLPLFIFDEAILKPLEDRDDARVGFIHDQVQQIKTQLQKKYKSDLEVRHGQVLQVFQDLMSQYQIENVYTNHDYEPQAVRRDEKVKEFLAAQKIGFLTFKDQVIFEKDEVLSDSRKPYTVYTPYKKKWLVSLTDFYLKRYPVESYSSSLLKVQKVSPLPSLEDLGFRPSSIQIPALEVTQAVLKKYHQTRDFPGLENGTSRLGCHLRFGTISIRELATEAKKLNETYLSELIWRDFFMQILHHHPRVVSQSFRPEYDQIQWRTSSSDFERWCAGQTGYPLVDAGMRELNQTGHMHNRVRMVVASFLTKHLLIHWSQGEHYFARKLLDFDLAANNGNWQWAAGSGCDAAPYFRIFNPTSQAERFDPDEVYIRKWVPEYQSSRYPKPMVDHVMARERCLTEFKKAVGSKDKS